MPVVGLVALFSPYRVIGQQGFDGCAGQILKFGPDLVFKCQKCLLCNIREHLLLFI